MTHRRPYRPLPPLTFCGECGRTHRNWKRGALCSACVREVAAAPPLNLRELRKRLQAIPLTRPASPPVDDPPDAA